MKITPKETYLATAWGDSVDNVVIKDIKHAIADTLKTDDEHGAFWVIIINENEFVLEAHRDMTVIGSFAGDPKDDISMKCSTWSQVEDLFATFLDGEIGKVKEILETNRI